MSFFPYHFVVSKTSITSSCCCRLQYIVVLPKIYSVVTQDSIYLCTLCISTRISICSSKFLNQIVCCHYLANYTPKVYSVFVCGSYGFINFVRGWFFVYFTFVSDFARTKQNVIGWIVSGLLFTLVFCFLNL